MKRFLLAIISSFLVTFSTLAQTVPFPPNPGNTGRLENWGYTNVGTNWDTSPYLPFILNGLKFRMMLPNGVTWNPTTKVFTNSIPGKKYPLMIFFHGNGEAGTDNNNQLNHGGLQQRNAIQNGTFPGFAFYPQSETYQQTKDMLERIIVECPVDINQIYAHGLSGGGNKTWQFTNNYTTVIAAAFPMSATDSDSQNEHMMYTPLRESQGALDGNPSPAQSQGTVNYFNNNGGHLEYFYMPGVGHGTWDAQYARPDFFSWFLSHKKNEIQVRFNRNLICPEAAINVDMGFSPGFDAYEWQKDGVTISGQTAYKLIATSYGSYTGRIKNRGVWSEWSAPVTVGVKPVTNTPPITVNGLKSVHLPALDGSTTTELLLPAGYASYSWKNASNTVVSTSQIYTAVPTGTYTATANEVNGCTTIPSPAFKVLNASGINSPDAIDDFLGYATSVTSVTLAWADKPSPNYNETGFEIYRSATAATGPFALVAITAADAIGYTDNGLTPNVTYYYKIRPVNQYSAGPASSVANVLTQVDNIAPTAPGSFITTGTTPTSAAFSWTASTDNVGVFRYDIYKDGVKVISTTSLTASVYNLTPGQLYKFVVKARDATGNSSTESNLVILNAVASGLQYSYYENNGTTYSALPNFASLTSVSSGYTPNIDISVRKRDVNFAMMWTGMINIPVAGAYTFMTNSDDGSKLYIGTYAEANLVVNNDGGHGAQDREGTKNFAAPGLYPIVITYYQGTGGFNMNIYWKNTAHGVVAKTAIPNSAFTPATTLPGNPPAAPTALTATAVAFDKINLTWVDNSANENGFRILRSTANTGPFVPVATVANNITTYQDQSLAGNTTYYYRVIAFGDYGESALSTQVPRGFTYSYYEAASMTSLSQINGLTPMKTGSTTFFDVAVRDRSENMAIRYVGKLNITVAATYTFYTSADDGSTLSIDGVQVVANDTDGAQHEKSGTKAMTVGWHDIDVKWRKRTSASSRLTVSFSRPSIGKTAYTSGNTATYFFGTEINAKTLALPPVPLVPTNVTATNPMPTTVSLTWTDNATNETSYRILRSYKTNSSYVIYKTLPVNSNSFLDEGLFANATYYYKVQPVGDGGTTTSAEVFVTTANNPPVITAIQDVAVKFGTVLDLNIYSQDLDNDPITLSVTGLPAFGNLVDQTDGSGYIHFAPASNQLGSYPMVVSARDNHNGVSTTHFTLTVTDKVAPVINAITNPVVNEGQTASAQIQASSDFGNNKMVWSFTGLPGFVTKSINNGICTLTISPTYTDAGAYAVDVTVTDSLASATKSFIITVNTVDPNQKISVNMVSASNGAAPWNNMTGVSKVNLIDNNSIATTMGVQLQTASWLVSNAGAITGNNSGIFPDNVIRDYYYFGFNGGPNTVDVKVSGLDVSRKYYFTFFGSSNFTGVPDNGSTLYAIGGTVVSLRVQNNSLNVANINSVSPAADGTVTFKMSKAAGTPVGYLNAFTFESVYQDGTVPAAPRNVQATFINSNVTVGWVDAPFNEDGFDIYRATAQAGPFTKINDDPLLKNSTSYIDSTVLTGTTYYYELKAFNAFGESVFSNVASTILPILPPKVKVTGDVAVAPDAFGMMSIATTTDATLTVTGMPSFAYLTQSSASTVDIVLLPGAIDAGTYQLTATAVNNTLGLTTVLPITLTVTERSLYKIYVNFGSGATLAGTPWNNTAKAPAANDVFANLKNDSNVGSGVSLTLQTAFGGYYNEGAQTGNNSGVVPDAVLKEYYYFGIFGSASDIYMKVAGLSTGNKYRFKFIGSSTWTNGGTIANNGTTIFSIGAQSASVAVQANTTKFAVLENVITNSVGEVIVHLSKGSGTSAGFINGMIIEALPVDVSKFTPTLLDASGYSKTQINLTWSDNSPVETGYEIYRSATGQTGSYTLLTTTAADVSSYIDVPPLANKIYYYQVRAKTTTGFSDYTNVAQSSTVAFKVYVNVANDAQYDAPAPWNNLSRFGFTGDVFVGFRDDLGLNTGLRMKVQTQLESGNAWGVNTGNNSGIFPDKVLTSFWFNDAYFPQGEFIIDGLDQTFNYNFGFLGSIVNGTPVNTDFTIKGVTVTNKNDNNKTTVSYLRNVKPDANGEILFTVKETAGSPWSIWNVLIIEGFAKGQTPGGRLSQSSIQSTVLADEKTKQVRYGEATDNLSFYPNPVESQMHVLVDDSSIGTVRYKFFDLMGKEVQSGQFNNDSINASFDIGVDLIPGIYLMKVSYPNGNVETKKFVKN